MAEFSNPEEPQTRGDEVLDVNGAIWERSNKGWWVCRGTFGRLHWHDLLGMYGPVRVHKQKGVTANG